MKSFFKNFFKYKISEVSFDEMKQVFVIDDHEKFQLWTNRFTGICNIIISVSMIYDDSFPDLLGWFMLVATFIYICYSILFLVSDRLLSLEVVQSISYRKFLVSSTGYIKLKNNKRRFLYHYDLSQLESQIELFKSKGIEVKEKDTWFK